MEGLIIIVLIIVLLLAGPIIASDFNKRQDEINRQLVGFIIEHYDELASGITLDHNGKAISRYSKLTRYRYCYSYLVMTTSNSSAYYLADEYYSDENAKNAKLTCQLITALSGWWGIPWGIINSFRYLFSNGVSNGTNDSTVGEIMNRIAQQAQQNVSAKE